eukprot:529751-Karenia_brevis.AAC.1
MLETGQEQLATPSTAAPADFRTIVPFGHQQAAAPEPPAAERKVISLGGLDPREVIDALVPATQDVPTP